MKAEKIWADLGWRHPLWDLLRFYSSLRGDGAKLLWLKKLISTSKLEIEGSSAFTIPKENTDLLVQYLRDRANMISLAFESLRSEGDALKHCEEIKVAVGKTATKNAEHHQSSKALVASVSAIAMKVARLRGLKINPDPQKRCVWCNANGLHVTARNLDGAIPGLANPVVVWEIKEYWGVTKGGSKMSDAVYECNLVGRELREFEDLNGIKVAHIVFVDGKNQWTARKSDLVRLIDLLNQGFIDFLFVGKEIETSWEPTLHSLLADDDQSE
jgi:hypothetical protein